MAEQGSQAPSHTWDITDNAGRQHRITGTKVVTDGPLVSVFDRAELVAFFVNPSAVTRAATLR